MRRSAESLAPVVQRNLRRFRKNDSVVKALLAVTATDLVSEDVAESVAAFGAVILPVFRENYPQLLDAPYTKDYTVRRSPVEIQGRQVQLPEERSIVELDAQSRRALVILEDVVEMLLAFVFDGLREYFGDDIDDGVKSGSAAPRCVNTGARSLMIGRARIRSGSMYKNCDMPRAK